MTVSRQDAGRILQKRRTRLAIVAAEAALASTHPDIAPALDAVPADDVFARFDIVCSALFDRVSGNEAQMRHMLQLAQEEWLANQHAERTLRTGRRLDWIEEALEPLGPRLDPDRFG